ncbi:hypothetical protein RQP46_011271 [Phenoliferia psychrophenolica]
MTTLKAEIKAWEALFRSEHDGQDPTKADIKANDAIAQKYKQYRVSKTSAVPDKPSAVPPPSAAPPPQPSIFKTPTKPKPARTSTTSASQSSTVPAAIASTSQSSSKPASPPKPPPTYVIANSPSKLRALAASHSPFAPNTAPAGLGSASGGRSGRGGAAMAGGGIVVVGSPKKYNPFRVGGADASSDELMRSRSRSPKKPARNGFEHDLMDLDERKKDDERQRFGIEGRGASVFARSSSASRDHRLGTAHPSAGKDFDMAGMTDDDEVLGPSPVKPSAKGKSFRPLFVDEPPPVPTKPAKPRLFQGDLSHLRSLDPLEPPKPKKRPSGSTFDPDKPLKVSTTGPNENNYQSEWTGGDEDANEPSTKKGKGKKGKATKPRAVGGAKGKSRPTKFSKPAVAVAEEPDEFDEAGFETRGSIQRRKDRLVRVLDLEDSDEEDEEEADDDAGDADEREAAGEAPAPSNKRERITVHPIRPYFRPGQTDDGDDDGRSAPGSLYYRDSADLLSSSQHSQPTSQLSTDDTPMTTPGELDSLDADLAELLELRSSPAKKTALLREKERELRIKRLLDEPSLKKPRRGLADLADEGGSEQEGETGEGGSDDDWASDADGWKDLGDGAMDEYDEAW